MKRIPELDFLRACGVILVMLLHAEASPLMVRMGWAGVDLFFVLSGFLVSSLLFVEYRTTGRIRPLYFLARRGFKIYPSFYAVLLIHVLYYTAKEVPISESQLWAEVLFFQNYRPGLMGISWSLAIEEHFYLLLVLSIFVFWKTDKSQELKSVPAGCVAICISCISFRIYTYLIHGYSGVFVNDFPSHLRMDALAFGLLLSYWYHFRRVQFERFFSFSKSLAVPVIGAILPVCILERQTFFINTFGYTLLYLSFGVIISIAVVGSPANHRKFNESPLSGLWRFMIWIGKHSYCIYLVHFIVGTGTVSLLRGIIPMDLPTVVYVVFYLGACIVAGAVITILIERPFLRIREKYFPKHYVNKGTVK